MRVLSDLYPLQAGFSDSCQIQSKMRATNAVTLLNRGLGKARLAVVDAVTEFWWRNLGDRQNFVASLTRLDGVVFDDPVFAHGFGRLSQPPGC